jgi:hypothetical protein
VACTTCMEGYGMHDVYDMLSDVSGVSGRYGVYEPDAVGPRRRPVT